MPEQRAAGRICYPGNFTPKGVAHGSRTPGQRSAGQGSKTEPSPRSAAQPGGDEGLHESQDGTERLLKASRLHLEKSWLALDLKRLPAKVVQQLRGLLSGEFLDRQGNALGVGPPGPGERDAV